MSTHQLIRFSRTARLLHWLSAIVILWAIGSGFFIVLMRPEKAVIANIAELNIAITLLFIPVFIFRLLVAYFNEKPSTPNLSIQQQNIANKVHVLIYGVVCTVLISGVLMMEHEIKVFNWFVVPEILDKGLMTQTFFILHRVANIILSLLLIMHIVAVIKHQLNGVPLLKKMI
ncbi:MAG: cytochrome b/b6 domain-containing protein [Colwellia sp.]|nr:cytochrome b/b6 domain-containing protein [Colwellia sp.]